jgi:putative Mg2+ transporter-C (MgtC) family protein
LPGRRAQPLPATERSDEAEPAGLAIAEAKDMLVATHASGIALGAAVAGGQGLKQLGELGLAFVLSSLIGLEREWRQKSAGLRTHALVGVGAALFVLVGKYGFSDVLGSRVTLDPSRVAAAIVAGIGFIGGGLIFVRGDAVRGLTTAAIVWITAAVGMACGSGLVILALVVTGVHFVTVLVYPSFVARLPRSRHVGFRLRIVYEDGRGILRGILGESTRLGYAIGSVDTRQLEHGVRDKAAVAATVEVRGQPTIEPLTLALHDLDGIHEVSATDLAEQGD